MSAPSVTRRPAPQQLGYTEVNGTLPSPAVSAVTVITGLTTTVPVGSRGINVVVCCQLLYGTVANDNIAITIYEDGVEVRRWQDRVLAANNGAGVTFEKYLTPAAGSHTYDARVQRLAGTGLVGTSGISSIRVTEV